MAWDDETDGGHNCGLGLTKRTANIIAVWNDETNGVHNCGLGLTRRTAYIIALCAC